MADYDFTEKESVEQIEEKINKAYEALQLIENEEGERLQGSTRSRSAAPTSITPNLQNLLGAKIAKLEERKGVLKELQRKTESENADKDVEMKENTT